MMWSRTLVHDHITSGNCEKSYQVIWTHEMHYGVQTAVGVMNRLKYFKSYYNAGHRWTLLGPLNNLDVISRVYHNNVALLWNWYHLFAWWQSDRDILTNYLEIIYKLSDSHELLTMPYIARHGLGPFGEKINHPSEIFMDTRNAWTISHRKESNLMYFEQLLHNYTLWTDLNILLVRLS